jgi:hypothetical protein
MSTERRAVTRAGFLPAVLVASAFATDCTSDHASLAAHPHAAGAGGKAGGASAGAGAGGKSPSGNGAKGGSGGAPIDPDKHVEPKGRSVFTVLHGIVDADRVAWCFARVRDDATELVGTPLPEDGMGYGQSLSFEELPHIDNQKDGLVPFVITGDLSLIAGLDCADAVARANAERPRAPEPEPGSGGSGGTPDAAGSGGESGEGGQSGAENGGAGAGDAGAPSRGGAPGVSSGGGEGGAAPIPEPPALRVGMLPGLPAGTLAQGYSLLEVADGCLGAPGFVAARSDSICGAGYTPGEGSLTAEFVILGRQVTAGMLAMQALHASRGSPSLGVRVAPPADSLQSYVTLVDNFSEGALRPAEPRRDLPNTAYGTAAPDWSVQATLNGIEGFSEPWSAVQKRSGVKTLENGRGYTLVVLGPSYTVEERGWWNPLAFGLIDNDPAPAP